LTLQDRRLAEVKVGAELQTGAIYERSQVFQQLVGNLQAEEALDGFAGLPSIGYSYNYDTRTSGLSKWRRLLPLVRFAFGRGSAIHRTNALALIERRFLNNDLTLRARCSRWCDRGTVMASPVTERFFASSELRGFEDGIGPRDLDTTMNALGGQQLIRCPQVFEAGIPNWPA
jgi:outer membrane protein insertion porin family